MPTIPFRDDTQKKPSSAFSSCSPFVSVMAGIVRKVDVAQWVDDRAFLCMDIRLRHQRNQNDRGSVVPSHLLTSYNGGTAGDCSILLRFQNIICMYLVRKPGIQFVPPRLQDANGRAKPFRAYSRSSASCISGS